MRDSWRPEFLRTGQKSSGRQHYYESMGAGRDSEPPRRERRREAPPADPVRERKLARARKMKALADRPGTEAEGAAATLALRRYVKKHGLSMREI